MTFKKAERRQHKPKLAITGPSGSGKTFSGLLLASGMGKKIAVIDTENGSASLYADMDKGPLKGMKFDVLEIDPPYTIDKYVRAIEEAQAEALCFGWTDVKSKNIDHSRYALRFTPRRANSVWSLTNIRRVETLIAEGRMTEAGLAKITEAQLNGQWEAGIRSEETDQIPADLAKALRQRKGALSSYRSLPHSRKKQLLRGLLTAKSEVTRQRRIAAIVQEVVE